MWMNEWVFKGTSTCRGHLVPYNISKKRSFFHCWKSIIILGERGTRGRVRAEPSDPKRTKGYFRCRVFIDRSTHPHSFIRRAGCPQSAFDILYLWYHCRKTKCSFYCKVTHNNILKLNNATLQTCISKYLQYHVLLRRYFHYYCISYSIRLIKEVSWTWIIKFYR